MSDTLSAKWTRAVSAAQAATGMTDARLADELGCARPTLSRKKNGHADWTATDMQRLRSILGPAAEQVAQDFNGTLVNGAYANAASSDSAPTGDTGSHNPT